MTLSGKFGSVAWAFTIHIALVIIFVVAICSFSTAQADPYVGAAATVEESADAPALAVASDTIASEDNADQPILTITKRVDEVNVLFIATDRHGKFVRNLTQNDFSILDDHKPVEAILNFRRETDLPIELGLLMDVSGIRLCSSSLLKEAGSLLLRHLQ